MVAAPLVIPSVDEATGCATVGLSAWVFTATASGWFEDTVTAYCLLWVRPGAPSAMSSESGSIGFAVLGWIVLGRTMVGGVVSMDLMSEWMGAGDDGWIGMMAVVAKGQ